jgi:hypothetical protein
MKSNNSKEEIGQTPSQTRWTRTHNDTYNKKFKADLAQSRSKKGQDKAMAKRTGAGSRMNEDGRAVMQPLVQPGKTLEIEDQDDSLCQDMDE